MRLFNITGTETRKDFLKQVYDAEKEHEELTKNYLDSFWRDYDAILIERGYTDEEERQRLV